MEARFDQVHAPEHRNLTSSLRSRHTDNTSKMVKHLKQKKNDIKRFGTLVLGQVHVVA
jgi:hypothetical protein